MKHLVLLSAIGILGATSVAACPWAGGNFSGNQRNFRAQFTVNSDCTGVVFQSSGSAGFQRADTPEKFALTESNQGWQANINGVTATFLTDGRWVNFTGSGVNSRVQFSKRHSRGGTR